MATLEGEDAATGAPLETLTPTRFVGDLRYDVAAWNLALGLRTEVAGPLDDVVDPAFARDGYTLFDVYATWRPVDGLRVDMGVDNLADEVAERVFAGVPEPGRSGRVAVTWSRGF